MRCSSLAVFGALWFLAASSVATAQIQVTAQAQRNDYLLYERVDMLVTIQNMGDSDLILNNNEGHPWLSFLVTKREHQNHLPVRPERTSGYQQLTLKVGASKTLDVNITPLFSFREEGDYDASAVIDLPGQGQVISEAVPFKVLDGRKIWSQSRPVDGTQRVYSLIRFSPEPDRTELYLRVEGPSENIVYANLALGELVAFVDPGIQFDPQGNLHILHPIAMGTYLYTRADPDGKILHQNIFKTYQEIPPRLVKVEDGNVIVNGGLAEDPNTPREKLSDAQNVKKADPSSPNSMQ